MVIALLLVAGLFQVANLAWGQPPAPQTQEKAAGGVTLTVTFVNPTSEKKEERLAFKVVMNTHTVALEQYPFKELVLLRDDRGKEYPVLSWQASGGGHHIDGVAEFANLGSEGKALTKSTKFVELAVKNVAGVPLRTFRWQLAGN